MTNITPSMIKELRDRTGVGMGKCKQALVDAGGDVQKAVDLLRKAGMTSAVKKEGRATKEGMIGYAQDEKALALVEVNAETDFVVQNEKFSQFIEELCSQALETKPSSIEEFLKQPYKKDPSITLEQSRALMIQSFGENIVIRRVDVHSKTSNTSLGVYSHMGGKIVSLVEIEGSNELQEFTKGIAMHIAAESPEYLDVKDVPKEIKEREEEIGRAQVKGKPENIIDKIIAGKFQAFCDQTCLLCQKFIKDTSITVRQYLEKESKKIGKDLSIKSFIRWQVGS